MITFEDVNGDGQQAQCTISTKSGVNGEKSLTGVIYFGQDVKDNISKGWSLTFKDDEYIVITYKKDDSDNTVSFSAVQAFFYKLSKTGFYEEWNGSHEFVSYLDAIFKDTGYSYTNTAAVPAFEKENWGMTDRLSLFNDIIDQSNTEFWVQSKVVYIVNKMGSDLSTVVRKKFNLNKAQIETDNSSFATYGRGFGAYVDDDDHSKGRLSVDYKSPLYDLYYSKFGAIEATPIADERYTIAANLLAAVKKVVDNSWAISLSMTLVDLQSAGYDYAMATAGDSVTVVDESLNFDGSVRILKVDCDYDITGKLINTEVECGNLSFAEQQKTSQATIDNIVAGKVPLPNKWLTQQVQIATNDLLNARTELQFTDQGILAVEKGNANNVVLLNSAGLGVSTDGGKTFKTAVTAKGVVADVLFGNLIKGVAFETTSSDNSFTIRLSGGNIKFKNGTAEMGGIVSTTDTKTGKKNGFAIWSNPGWIFSINQGNNDGTSVPLIQIPANSTVTNPIVNFYGTYNHYGKESFNSGIDVVGGSANFSQRANFNSGINISSSIKSKANAFWIQAPSQVILSGNNGGGNQLNVYGDHVDVLGNFTVYNGSKNAAQVTREGMRATPAYEMAENYVGDIGESVTDDDCTVKVSIDPLVFDLINTDFQYQVFLTAYSDDQLWVSERGKDCFIVKSNSPNTSFGWELKGKRRGYETERLVDTGKTYAEVEKMEGGRLV